MLGSSAMCDFLGGLAAEALLVSEEAQHSRAISSLSSPQTANCILAPCFGIAPSVERNSQDMSGMGMSGMRSLRGVLLTHCSTLARRGTEVGRSLVHVV